MNQSSIDSLLVAVDTALAGRSAADGPGDQLIQQHGIRVVAGLREYLSSDERTVDESVLLRAADLVDRYIPVEYDAQLPVQLRPWAWLTRRRDSAGVTELGRFEREYSAVTRSDGVVWIDGVLHVRTATRWVDGSGRSLDLQRADDRVLRVLPKSLSHLPQDLLDVTDDVTALTISLTISQNGQNPHVSLGTSSSSVLEDSSDRVDLLTPVVRAEGRLDLLRAAEGEPLRDADWTLLAGTDFLDAGAYQPVLSSTAPRPAIVGTIRAVAFASAVGALGLNTSSRRSDPIEYGRPRLKQGILAQRWLGGTVSLDIRVPLDGIRTKEPAVIVGRSSVVRSEGPAQGAQRRWLDRALDAWNEGPATVSHDGDSLVLAARVRAKPGNWRLVFRTGPHAHATQVQVHVSEGRPSVLSAVECSAPPRERPLVSVVMPVYNAGEYLEPAIRSVLDQTLDPDAIEIVAVNDGSTDGSREVLHDFAADDPRIRVIDQENFGSDNQPRNRAIDESRGKYVFPLDADDLLAPDALEKLTEAAEGLGAEVVMGRLAGLGGRRPPQSMFRYSDTDADLIENNLLFFLGPQKLFLREHLDTYGIRAPESYRVGSDQPLSAAALLSASRVAVLADGDYYFIRTRDDGGVNLTHVKVPIEQVFLKAQHLAATITHYTEPGRLRDRWLWRAYSSALAEFVRGLPQVPKDELHGWIERTVEIFSPWWTPRLRDSVTARTRIMLELVLGGHTEAFLDLMAQARGNERRLKVALVGQELLVDVPDSVRDVLPASVLRVDVHLIKHLLTGVESRSECLAIRGAVGHASFTSGPDQVRAVVKRRGRSGHEVDLPVRLHGAVSNVIPKVASTQFEIELEPARLPASGVWDLSIACSWSGQESVLVRFGSKRARDVVAEPVAFGDSELYFTATHGNISVRKIAH